MISISCSKNCEELNTNLDMKQFEESVLISPFETIEINKLKIAIVSLKNFNDEYSLKPAYTFSGIIFNDDGKYNDKIAGDNIYTSVQNIVELNEPQSIGWKMSENFKFKDDLLKQKIFPIGCKVRRVPCPEDGGFWDSDWRTGWGCVDFYDCSFSIF